MQIPEIKKEILRSRNTKDTFKAIDDQPLCENLKLFPNPAKDQVYIEKTNDFAIQSVEIFDLFGKKIKSIKEVSSVFSVTDLSEGIYVLQLATENRILLTKLGIKR
jgi:hypothetical protein